ncbi:MAG: homoserine dehydrogenase, partial [Planctomycetota bacterium]
IIANISQCLSANGIQLLEGILNGTSNFIVSQMEQHGMAYADAVRLAQDKGYAEADPTMDVDGTDAAQKLAILAHLAFGAEVDWAQIPRIGVDLLETQDLQFAAQLGYRIKLLATANLTDDGLELHVSPTLVRRGTPLAEVTDAFNAVHVVGDAVGPVFYHGQGAGQMPTASAVVADLIDTAVGRAKLTFNTLEYFSTEQPPRVKLRDHDQLSGRMYFRMAVKDSPGTLASITGAMGKHGISIASVIQHESRSDSEDDTLPLVIMTSAAPEGAAAAAAAVMEDLPSVAGRVVRLRVKD